MWQGSWVRPGNLVIKTAEILRKIIFQYDYLQSWEISSLTKSDL